MFNQSQFEDDEERAWLKDMSDEDNDRTRKLPTLRERAEAEFREVAISLGQKPKAIPHDYYTQCSTGDCGGTCHYCTISICKVCGLFEGALTTDCPGVPSVPQMDSVYNGKSDFIDGNWVNKSSPHSPNQVSK